VSKPASIYKLEIQRGAVITQAVGKRTDAIAGAGRQMQAHRVDAEEVGRK
jgi:hypothetical protein